MGTTTPSPVFSRPVVEVTVRSIENGYILRTYDPESFNGIEWYCINLEEVMEKMSRYI